MKELVIKNKKNITAIKSSVKKSFFYKYVVIHIVSLIIVADKPQFNDKLIDN
jgi:hypothetical protein